jgi:ribonuclease T1
VNGPYTVTMPGVSTRGARRVVTGDDGTDYCTADHYDTFVVIVSSC